MTEFQRQLKDPRWQKKRLEVMERDEWTCQGCADITATLTVHHKSYRMIDGKFADIWDYPNEDLITLCETCHSEEEGYLSHQKTNVFFHLREFCENSDAIHTLSELVLTLHRDNKRRVSKDDILALYQSSDHGRKIKKVVDNED